MTDKIESYCGVFIERYGEVEVKFPDLDDLLTNGKNFEDAFQRSSHHLYYYLKHFHTEHIKPSTFSEISEKYKGQIVMIVPAIDHDKIVKIEEDEKEKGVSLKILIPIHLRGLI
ncbi:MAG: hypothetical protein GY714_10665 [Desulfobacterales bacterium]|nr:hypothetical protein [Desulfobacterales bacterium]